jgi:phasin family protein
MPEQNRDMRIAAAEEQRTMVDQVEPGDGDKGGAAAPTVAPTPVANEPVAAPSAKPEATAPAIVGKAGGTKPVARKPGPARKAPAKAEVAKPEAPKSETVVPPAPTPPPVETPVAKTPVPAKAPAPKGQVRKAGATAKPASPAPKPVATPKVAPPTPELAKPEPVKTEPVSPKPVAASKAPPKPAAAPLLRTATAPKKEFSIMTATTEYSEKFQAAIKEASDKAKAVFEKGQSQIGELGEFTKGNVEALVESNKILASGLQELAKGYVSESKSAFETLTAEIKELAAVKTPSEFLEKQSALLRKNFDAAVAASSKNSEAVLKLANEAFQPISNRVSLAVEKVKKAA